MNFKHVSVLLEECIESLEIKPNGIYVDGTLGGAGHSYEICKKLNKEGMLIGIDQDENAIEAATKRLDEYKDIISINRANFSQIKEVLLKNNISKVDGILLDLGVSSYQLDEASRGFSYMNDADLDMRMDQRQEFTAKDIVNDYSEERLHEIIKNYGEDRWAKRIAQFIVAEREIKPIETTYELVSVIKKAIPKAARRDGPHPAKRTFQAIRIELNGELSILEKTIEDMVDVLNEDGRLCIITFHSLEDRIVKQVYRKMMNPCTCPREFPICICNKTPQGKVITRKPILPSEEELEVNSRSRSAKLRVFEKK